MCRFSTTDVINTFITRLESHNIESTWHSFIQLPNAHCFGTYDIPESEFGGADLLVTERLDTVKLFLFYKGGKTEADFTLETELEEDLRPAAEYFKTSGFDNNNGLFYSCYQFRTREIEV